LKENQNLKLAILDMYEGMPNEGMRSIRQLVEELGADLHIP